MRTSEINRKTAETDVTLRLDLDGTGKNNIKTCCGFMDHMLTLFACHGKFDLDISCVGDTNVDDHHSVEDIGICLGEAFSEALGDKAGITRYGSMILPMDEALILSAVDFSGRGMLCLDLDIPSEKIGTFDTELVEEFLTAFARSAKCTLHIRELAGRNSHHIVEGMFKGLARAMREAVSIDERENGAIPSSKGVL